MRYIIIFKLDKFKHQQIFTEYLSIIDNFYHSDDNFFLTL
jgi:hypothetical protein